MRKTLSVLAVCLFVAPAFADDKPQRPVSPELRQKLLEQFDADKDGKLNEEERAKARAEFEKRRGNGKDRPAQPNAEAAKKRFQGIIAKFDKDGDGRLNEEERAAAQKARQGVGGPNPEAAKKRFQGIIAKFDKDGDGRLNEEERAAAQKAMGGQFANRRAEIVKKFDKDGDGKLNAEEQAAARKALGGQAGAGRPNIDRAEVLKKFDKDDNGTLDDAEKAAVKKHFEELRAKRGPAGADSRPKADAPARRRVNPEALKKFDKDGDGKLSPEERKAAIDAARAKKADE
jgi:Ca2+-binding EF-hand superfamily protein